MFSSLVLTNGTHTFQLNRVREGFNVRAKFSVENMDIKTNAKWGEIVTGKCYFTSWQEPE